MGEAQILGKGGVEHPDRVGIGNAIKNFDFIPLPIAPHSRGEIAHPIDSKNGRFFKRGNVESRSHVTPVVFDKLNLRFQVFAFEAQRFGEIIL